MQRNEEKTKNPNLFLIILHDSVHVVDSRLIAEALGVKHINFLDTLKKYQVKAFNQIRFKTETGKMRPQRMEEFEVYLSRVRKHLGIQAMCFVYVFYSPALNMYKIGWADDTEIRQQTLQTPNPSLEFVLGIPVLNRRAGKSLENTLHLQFDYCRHQKTEWFSLSESDLLYCQMLRILNEGKMEEMPTT